MSTSELQNLLNELEKTKKEEITPDEWVTLFHHLQNVVTNVNESIEKRKSLWPIQIKIQKLCQDKGYFEH